VIVESTSATRADRIRNPHVLDRVGRALQHRQLRRIEDAAHSATAARLMNGRRSVGGTENMLLEYRYATLG
jgi:hypothetical protein